MISSRLLFICGVLFLVAQASKAQVVSVPGDLGALVTSEAIPFVFKPADFTGEDFQPKWIGQSPPNVKAQIPGYSLEWVRHGEKFVLPRARLMIEANGYDRGSVRSWDYVQSFVPDEKGNLSVGLPIALISDPGNAVEIQLFKNGKKTVAKLMPQFQPRDGVENRVMMDSNCSNFNVQPVAGFTELPKNTWMYVSCHKKYVFDEDSKTSSFDLFVFWDGVGQTIEVDGVPVSPASLSLWAIRNQSDPKKVRLKAKGKEIQLQYFVPKTAHWSFMGAGLGPYTYYYSGGITTQEDTNTLVPLLTLYGSYLVKEGTRLVFFDATSFHENYFSDLGLYVLLENFKGIDLRVSLNLLIGGNIRLFRNGDSAEIAFSAPQGAEVIFRDLFVRRWNLGIGAFLYPPIDNRSYYNAWIRYGTNQLFGEVNYIAWQEPVDGGTNVYARSLGITVGMPLFVFF